jgi:hypothetical protein
MITDEQIKETASEMDVWFTSGSDDYEMFESACLNFARAIYKLGVETEREECANVCKSIEYDYYRDSKCERAIRARTA